VIGNEVEGIEVIGGVDLMIKKVIVFELVELNVKLKEVERCIIENI
jgi:hypothetical protein